MKKYVPISASEFRRPYGTGRVLVRMSFSRPVVRGMDEADLGEANRSAFVEFGTRFLLALLEDDLSDREAREVKMLLFKATTNGGYEKVLENIQRIFGEQRHP